MEEEEVEGDLDFELSPGLEYFETVSDIDFTSELERDRDFDDWNEDVEGGTAYTIIQPETNTVVDAGLAALGGRIGPVDRFRSIKRESEVSKKFVEEADSSDEEDFIPFTLKQQ